MSGGDRTGLPERRDRRRPFRRARRRAGGPSASCRLTSPAPTTRFAANTDIPVIDLIRGADSDFVRPIFADFANPAPTTAESDVAAAVWLAATDASGKLRYPAGPDAAALARNA